SALPLAHAHFPAGARPGGVPEVYFGVGPSQTPAPPEREFVGEARVAGPAHPRRRHAETEEADVETSELVVEAVDPLDSEEVGADELAELGVGPARGLAAQRQHLLHPAGAHDPREERL